MVLRHRRANAPNSKDPSKFTNTPRTKALEGNPKVSDILQDLLLAKEWVPAFLWMAGDH